MSANWIESFIKYSHDGEKLNVLVKGKSLFVVHKENRKEAFDYVRENKSKIVSAVEAKVKELGIAL